MDFVLLSTVSFLSDIKPALRVLSQIDVFVLRVYVLLTVFYPHSQVDVPRHTLMSTSTGITAASLTERSITQNKARSATEVNSNWIVSVVMTRL